jgi:hypothetical protein
MLGDVRLDGRGIDVFENVRDHVAITLENAEDGRFSKRATTKPKFFVSRAAMAIFARAAPSGFI